MRAYALRRIALIFPTLLILSMLVFLTVRLIPGDIVDAFELSIEDTTDLDREAIMARLGLDQPIYVQYAKWMGDLFQGSLGNSMWADVSSIERRILEKIPVTVELGVMAIGVGLLLAIPIGVYSAMRQDTAADYGGRTLAIVGMATPNFWLGMMVMLYPAIWWGWTPPLEFIPITESPVYNIRMMIIPSVILGTAMAAGTMRLTRTMMLESLRQDYVRTAWSKGLTERVIVSRHVLKNALIPVITAIGMELPMLIGGSVIVESIFNLPGLGRYALDALTDRDYPVIAGVNLVFAVAVVMSNLVIDLIYPFLDPRVRYN
ncbi:ABC transporter permease [Dehalococcoidia bacterium]|nr:ABC transporter permease [Dehalococcoidia bacterium]